ncbi:MAG: hypothetical protein QOK21_3157 [Solirubrobacteraceae bacterium]|nr:hypothetical protein [Solirubrobacteraceae bacterium]
MFGRRILVLVAVLMGLTALAASLTPPPQSLRRGAQPPGPAATPGAAGRAPAPAARIVTARLSAGGRPRRISARTGDTVILDITAGTPDTVVIDDLAVSEPVDPQSPAQVELYADTAGRFPIALLDSGRRIGTLQITGSS